MASRHWSGEALLSAGFGAFRGTVGDHALHAHYAHQLVIALNGEVGVALPSGPLRAPGIAIPAGLAHCVCAEQALLVYLDPLTPEGAALFQQGGSTALPLAADLCGQLLAAADAGQALRATLRHAFGLSRPPAPDARMAAVAAALRAGVGTGGISRLRLAQLANLSPSRFSHWFVEQTGLPLRSYRKWLRLELALHQLAHGGNLTDAAHAAGFADSAHLSRTFREMFGLNPAALLQGIVLDSSFVQAA
ncbi:helix-turn-helix domain-containing protein [Duganella sp. CF458]|uniref:helix-turn-helix domain-containing protein n=1 Tax=Duganella sp. CF458 TaxID=1884368 RepID=UPI0014818E19|nr:helix-turn-helix domain-containing protein [Duganella sp. CF458]